MLTLAQKHRLLTLRRIFAYDMACRPLVADSAEQLAILSMMAISSEVVGALNEDAMVRSAPVERAEAIACAMKAAMQGIPSLLKQDPEVAYQLAIIIQTELDKTLREKPNDRTED